MLKIVLIFTVQSCRVLGMHLARCLIFTTMFNFVVC